MVIKPNKKYALIFTVTADGKSMLTPWGLVPLVPEASYIASPMGNISLGRMVELPDAWAGYDWDNLPELTDAQLATFRPVTAKEQERFEGKDET
jgi:hypothetical protein